MSLNVTKMVHYLHYLYQVMFSLTYCIAQNEFFRLDTIPIEITKAVLFIVVDLEKMKGFMKCLLLIRPQDKIFLWVY